MNECFTLSVRLACDSSSMGDYWKFVIRFTSNHIPFRFGCRPREASRLEAKTHEDEAKTHEAEAEAKTQEAEARFSGLEAEARPWGLISLHEDLFLLNEPANEIANGIRKYLKIHHQAVNETYSKRFDKIKYQE